MNMGRTFRRLVSAGLIGLMLFAQLAIAAYACPTPRSAGAQSQPTAVADAAMAAMPDCSQMAGAPDEAAPNLCAEHCRFGQQGNQSHVPVLPAVTLVSLYTVAATAPEDAATLPVAVRTASLSLPVAVPIPHTILHCCIRD